MSDYRKCPDCGQTINSANDFLYCTRRTPCTVAAHHVVSGAKVREFFASEEAYLERLMGKIHGLYETVELKVEDVLGIPHDEPPTSAVSLPPELTPAATSVEPTGVFSSDEQVAPAPDAPAPVDAEPAPVDEAKP